MKFGIANLLTGFLLPSTFLALFYTSAFGSESLLKWTELPPLPPAPGQEVQVGLAGAFAGVHNDVLILAGGANFPDSPPWEGGQKVWHDDIYVLQRDKEGNYHWLTNATLKLPMALAYGVSITTDKGIIIIGGCDAEHCYNNVFRLQWDATERSIDIKSLPSLPCPGPSSDDACDGQGML
ncbi:unnamed protein product [marine sediment metagenome]|uniref:Glyoxal oxidase N-terminal domain-containing protein n=1 Tax=marine sediment metagenome TaxID=412755 RepID=X1A1V3_9ZZZZ